MTDLPKPCIVCVASHPDGVTPKKVARDLGLGDKEVSTYLYRALNSGRVVRPTRGLYLPPVGSVGSVGIERGASTPPCHMCHMCHFPPLKVTQVTQVTQPHGRKTMTDLPKPCIVCGEPCQTGRRGAPTAHGSRSRPGAPVPPYLTYV